MYFSGVDGSYKSTRSSSIPQIPENSTCNKLPLQITSPSSTPQTSITSRNFDNHAHRSTTNYLLSSSSKSSNQVAFPTNNECNKITNMALQKEVFGTSFSSLRFFPPGIFPFSILPSFVNIATPSQISIMHSSVPELSVMHSPDTLRTYLPSVSSTRDLGSTATAAASTPLPRHNKTNLPTAGNATLRRVCNKRE